MLKKEYSFDNLEEAIADIDKELEEASKRALLYLDLGVSNLRSGYIHQARTDFNSAFSFDNDLLDKVDDKEVHLYLALACKESSEPSRAEEHLVQCLDDFQDNPDLFSLANQALNELRFPGDVFADRLIADFYDQQESSELIVTAPSTTDDYDQLMAELNRYKSKCTSQESDIRQQNQLIDELREYNQQLSDDFSRQIDADSQFTEEVISLQQQNQALEEQVRLQTQRADNYEQQIVVFQDMRNSYEGMRSDFESRVDGYEDQIARLEEQLSIYEKDNLRLNEQLSRAGQSRTATQHVDNLAGIDDMRVPYQDIVSRPIIQQSREQPQPMRPPTTINLHLDIDYIPDGVDAGIEDFCADIAVNNASGDLYSDLVLVW